MTPLQIAVATAWNAWRAPPRLTVATWANTHRKLSAESSAEPGQWRNSRAPHTVLPMECLSPADNTEVVVLKFSAQSSKTEIINNFIGYIADQDPGPILCLQPNEKPMAEAFSKDRIAPMIRDTPVLTEKFSSAVGRTSKNTILHKAFTGGHLTIAGANSPSSLASRPIRYILADEINRWEPNKEGDPLKLAIKRTRTFWNRKILMVSTPTLDDVGISREYESTQQYQWHVECPDCGEYQFPELKHYTFNRDENKALQSIDYTCGHCGTVHGEREERKIKGSGKWVQINQGDPRRKGFHFNQWASPFASWRDTAQEWFDAQGSPGQLQVVVNTAFAEEWKGVGEQLEWEALHRRRILYPHHESGLAVPDDVNHLLLVVDTQDNYFDWEVIGLGERLQTWGIEKGQIYGATDQTDAYDQLDELRRRVWPTESGGEIDIFATAIDIQGHRQRIVKEWCYSRRSQRVYAFAGVGAGAKKQINRTRDKLDDGTQRRVDVYNLRVDDFKNDAATFLAETDPDAYGYCSWPKDAHGGTLAGYDEEIFKQLSAERLDTSMHRGYAKKTWVKTRARNEAWDLRHYLYALIVISKPPAVVSERQVVARPVQTMPMPAAANTNRPEPSDWLRRGAAARVQHISPGDWMSRRR